MLIWDNKRGLPHRWCSWHNVGNQSFKNLSSTHRKINVNTARWEIIWSSRDSQLSVSLVRSYGQKITHGSQLPGLPKLQVQSHVAYVCHMFWEMCLQVTLALFRDFRAYCESSYTNPENIDQSHLMTSWHMCSVVDGLVYYLTETFMWE